MPDITRSADDLDQALMAIDIAGQDGSGKPCCWSPDLDWPGCCCLDDVCDCICDGCCCTDTGHSTQDRAEAEELLREALAVAAWNAAIGILPRAAGTAA